MNEKTFLSVFEGVPLYDIEKRTLAGGVSFTSLCTEHSRIFPSKGELRRMVQGGGVSLNKARIDDPDFMIKEDLLLNSRYLLVQKGKKNYYLIRAL
jgi:tyrosyl-tRNA synthetase